MYSIRLADEPVRYLKSRDKRLSQVIDVIGDMECHAPGDVFAFIAGEIVEQMLSIKAAACIRRRVVEMIGGNLSPATLESVQLESLCSCGVSRAKAACLHNFAAVVLSGELDLTALSKLDDGEVTKRLTAIKGIGSWTAKMCLIFVLQREDVLPFEDGAFLQSFRWLYGLRNPSRETVIRRCRKWKPYSSIAARYLYRALDTGMTKERFVLA